MLGTFTCSFTRRDCHCHDATLFHATYQRVNRTRHNKILRCFPHCCHGHSRRSYCGASLHVQVDFDTHTSSSSAASSSATATDTVGRVLQPHADDDVVVFARFRPLHQRSLARGTQLAPHVVLSSLQSDENPAGEWIESWLRASAHQNAWLFEINRSARWHYNWGSSAATTSRRTDHVLEVVVFVVRATSTTQSLEVVTTTQSPPFRLVSFRRATRVAAIEEEKEDGRSAPPPSPPRPAEYSRHTIDSPPLPSLVVPHAPLVHAPRPSDLAVLLSAANAVPHDQQRTRCLASFDHAFVMALARDTAMPRHAMYAPVGHGSAPWLSQPLPRPLSRPLPSASVTGIVVELALWLATDSDVRAAWHRTLLAAAPHVTTSRSLLWSAHCNWLVTLHAHVDAFLSTRSVWQSVEALARAVHSSSGRGSDSGSDIDLDDEAQEPALLSFRSFVASVRQTSVTQHKIQRWPPRLPRPTLAWWYCPLARVRLWPLDRPSATPWVPHETLSLPFVTWFYQQLACLSIVAHEAATAPGQPPTVTLSSAAGTDISRSSLPAALPSTGMTLVLDGRPRWAATLPNGDATLATPFANDWRVGDYAARRCIVTGALIVRWFVWRIHARGRVSNSVRERDAAFCVRLEVPDMTVASTTGVAVVTLERGTVVADVDGTVVEETESCAQRLRRVAAWTPRWRAELHYERVGSSVVVSR